MYVLVAICTAHLVTTPGQMACDTVLCEHINDRSTVSSIIGKREIWMASLQVLTSWSDFFSLSQSKIFKLTHR